MVSGIMFSTCMSVCVCVLTGVPVEAFCHRFAVQFSSCFLFLVKTTVTVEVMLLLTMRVFHVYSIAWLSVVKT